LNLRRSKGYLTPSKQLVARSSRARDALASILVLAQASDEKRATALTKIP